MGSSVMIRTPYTDWIFDRRGSYRQSTQVKHQDVVGEQLLGFCRRRLTYYDVFEYVRIVVRSCRRHIRKADCK